MSLFDTSLFLDTFTHTHTHSPLGSHKNIFYISLFPAKIPILFNNIVVILQAVTSTFLSFYIYAISKFSFTKLLLKMCNRSRICPKTCFTENSNSRRICRITAKCKANFQHFYDISKCNFCPQIRHLEKSSRFLVFLTTYEDSTPGACILQK